MSNGPQKRSGFSQGIYEISSVAKEVIGTLRVLADGRKFRYCKAGASALAAGKLGVGAAIVAAHTNQAILAAVAIGTKQITLIVTAGTAIAADALKGGALQVNDATGEGYSYPIDTNTALTALGTEITVTLETGIKVALDTTSEFTLVHNPCYGVVESTTLEVPIGVPLVAVTAAYYYWAQTGGLVCGLITGTPAAGSALQQCNGVAGAFEIYASGTITYPPIARIHGTAGVDTEYKPVWLQID
jgi:hypothetical protein